jgi:hypothetical protein
MADNTTVIRSGIGLPTLLFIVFLVLQLTGNIDWPWYAITAPILISFGVWALVILFGIVIAFFASR